MEWISHQIGRWGGSSRVNEGMGVNLPSVEALRPDHSGGIRTTRDLVEQGKKGSVREGRRWGITEEKIEGNSGETEKVLNRGEGE